MYSQDDTQIVFMDTPGLTTASERKKYNLVATFEKDPEVSISQADVIGIIQDVTNVYTRHKIADCIVQYLKSKRSDTPLLLIFNKVDKLKKKNVLLELANSLMSNEDGPKFEDIFMISALTGDGINDLRVRYRSEDVNVEVTINSYLGARASYILIRISELPARFSQGRRLAIRGG